MSKTIGNPVTWIAGATGRGSHYLGEGVGELGREDPGMIETRPLHISDLKAALKSGMEDFGALRTDVMFIVVLFPVIGMLLFWFALNRDLVHLLFPMVAGFALLGPVSAIGLYEMSRRRELGLQTGWSDAFQVMGSPSFVPLVVLGLYLAVIFVVWMFVAQVLYAMTLGAEGPSSVGAFLGDVFGTAAGWTMMIVGTAIGFVFALCVLAISLVSFPLLVDRHVGLPTAVVTSVRIARNNPVTVAVWGLIVVALLGVGIATLFIGLIVVLPILGHATWHLYRRAVVARAPAKVV